MVVVFVVGMEVMLLSKFRAVPTWAEIVVLGRPAMFHGLVIY